MEGELSTCRIYLAVRTSEIITQIRDTLAEPISDGTFTSLPYGPTLTLLLMAEPSFSDRLRLLPLATSPARCLGLVRETVIAYFLGTSGWSAHSRLPAPFRPCCLTS